jgi:hypothetical protein
LANTPTKRCAETHPDNTDDFIVRFARCARTNITLRVSGRRARKGLLACWHKTHIQRNARRLSCFAPLLRTQNAETAKDKKGRRVARGEVHEQGGMCWYYTDPSRTQGFWDYCR